MATPGQITHPTTSPTASPTTSSSPPPPNQPKSTDLKPPKQTQLTLKPPSIHQLQPPPKPTPPPSSAAATPLHRLLTRITTHPTLTPTRRRIYRTLLSVPEGRWTTYAALATYLGTSARAIGGAMRANPFAPGVPCHRVLAADRTLGGYKGEWGGREKGKEKEKGMGMRQREKRRLLEGEGVVFDERGRAKGECFGGFVVLG